MESNHPSGGLPRPAGFEDRMGHQTPAAPGLMLRRCSRSARAGAAAAQLRQKFVPLTFVPVRFAPVSLA
ncbi:MAG: hypothetical protein QOD76_1828 [Solirubrobacteraceae bacterium]|nr:hypothetical protein [Solirubrobacteraceae bacterium]